MKRTLIGYASATLGLVAVMGGLYVAPGPDDVGRIVLLVICAWLLAILVSWSYPYVISLRDGQLHVYLGPLRELESPDLVQAFYRDEAPFQNFLGLTVEILAIGNGDRIWQFEGVPADEQLASVRSVRVAVIPDMDESASRRLTPAERSELKRHILGFCLSSVASVAVSFIALSVAGLMSFWVFFSLLEYGVNIIALFAVLIADVALVLCLRKVLAHRLHFARTLSKDLKSGTVEGGQLRSGTPWVTSGLPAPWRLGTWRDASAFLNLKRRLRLIYRRPK